jgi:uncharacterized membrane protein
MDIVANFQDLVAQVPEFIQPFIVAVAGAVPFVEGEGAATIGIIGGVNPVVSIIAAAAGNFLIVLVLVVISSGARSAIVNRQHEKKLVHAGGGSGSYEELDAAAVESDRKSARKVKFQTALEKYGVPGVSLLGPLLLPTHFTATMLAASGVSKARVLFWQAIAIAGWATLFGTIAANVIRVVN